MRSDTILTVTEIQRFCMHDGPGLRTTVFLKGCPLHCAWCHNPETQRAEPELLFYEKKCIGCRGCQTVCASGAHAFDGAHCIDRARCVACFSCAEQCPVCALEVSGSAMTPKEILTVVRRDAAFYGKNGGITLSGGEPFLQGRATVELLKAAKREGFSTAVETCGFADAKIIREAIPFTDLFLWDVKDTDDARHERYTGVGTDRILQNLSLINGEGARIRLRCILVNGVNTETKHYEAIAEIARTIRALDGVEFLPYHAYAGTKCVFLGREDNGRTDWIPTEEQIGQAKSIVREAGVPVL